MEYFFNILICFFFMIMVLSFVEGDERVSYVLKDPILYYDVFFKALFSYDEELLLKFIRDITHIDVESDKEKIQVIYNEIPIHRRDEKFQRVDLIIKVTENFYVNVELNKNGNSDWKNKSISYIFKIYSIHTKRGKSYLNTKIYQININCFPCDSEPIIEYSLSPTFVFDEYGERKEGRGLSEFTDSISIYTYNIYKANYLYYNEYVEKGKEDIPNYIRWAAFLSLKDFRNTPDIMKGILNEIECRWIMKRM